jgi:polygalacturonase
MTPLIGPGSAFIWVPPFLSKSIHLLAFRQMDTLRRDLLKFSPLALAGISSPAVFAQAPTSSPLFFDVRHFGATGNGKTLDTPAVNAAIEAAAAAGGGTVVFPAGTYLCFSIRLKSHVHLYLSQGAVILAADSPKPGETTGQLGGTYDAAEPKTAWDAYQDYGHNHWHNSLLWGEDIHDFGITGPGLIFGKGLSRGYTAPQGWQSFVAEQAGVGNKAIALKNCRNVIFRDFSILKGGHFGLLLTGVDNLTIDNLTIDTDRDGMDLDCCKNARVINCTVNSPWDDAICPKSSYALGYARATENVTISNCYVTGGYELGSVIDGTWRKRAQSGTGQIKCGTESNGGFKNIAISNCVLEDSHGITLESEDGAIVEDIAISNITMRGINRSPFFLRLGARLRGPKETTSVGSMKRVVISNVVSSGANAMYPSIISGIPGHAIEDLKIANVYLQQVGGGDAAMAALRPAEKIAEYPEQDMFGPLPAQGFFLRHIRNLEMSHVEIAAVKPDARPSFYLEDVNRADFLAITAPTPGAFALHDVTDLRIHWSRAAQDTVLAKADHQIL